MQVYGKGETKTRWLSSRKWEEGRRKETGADDGNGSRGDTGHHQGLLHGEENPFGQSVRHYGRTRNF